MKNNKVLGFLIAGGACVLFLFSIFMFPRILSEPPVNRKMESIKPENVYTAEEVGHAAGTAQPGDPDQHEQEAGASVVIDINAISEEKATAIAVLAMRHRRDVSYADLEEMSYLCNFASRGAYTFARGARHELRGARYLQAVDHINPPIWQLLFTMRYTGASFIITPEEFTSEEYLTYLYENDTYACCETLSTEGYEQAVRRDVAYGALVVLDIDAFSGDVVGLGEVYLCDHESEHDIFRVDLDADWRLINEYVQRWFQFLESDMSIPAPKPMPIPESFIEKNDTWKDMIRVPDLLGSRKTQEDVEAVFSELGLKTEFRPVSSNFLPEGTIAHISNILEIVPEGTTIIIYVSSGNPHT